jgi:hypothetical protein
VREVPHEYGPKPADDHGMTMSELLQILVIYVAVSVGAGLPLGVALGVMIRCAERRHRQHVAQLMRARIPQLRQPPAAPAPALHTTDATPTRGRLPRFDA